jgi:hypothetical protein
MRGTCSHDVARRAMRFAMLALLLGCLGGCSLSVGGGASARVGRRPGGGRLDCDGFESCDAMYRAAVARAQRCQAEDGDCEQEDSDVVESYQTLRERTLRELDALRAEAREATDEAHREENEECKAGR